MSVELLRRAAAVLREAVDGLPERIRVQWESKLVHPFMDGQVEFRIGLVSGGPKVLDGVLPGGLPPFLALLDPPVALALADLLEAHIPLFSGLHTIEHEVFVLARAILREVES